MKALNDQQKVLYEIARTISTITNPCILSIAILLLISFTKSAGLSAALAQAIAIICLLVILPLAFVFLRTISQPDKKIYHHDPTLFLKKHPLDIIILGIVCGPSSWIILKILSAPVEVLDTLIALLAVAFILAIVNLFYRVSFHLAGITTLIIMTAVTWGTQYFFLLLVLPPTAWAKYTLHDHDVLQMVLGVGAAGAITAFTLHFF